MAGKFIVGIDGGSQSTKVTIFDTDGNVAAEGKERLRPMNMPHHGHVEHPDDDLWDSTVIACKRAMENFHGDKSAIIGIGLCTIRFCRVLLKDDGTLASPVMSWMDQRVSRPYESDSPRVRYVTTTSGYLTHRLTGQFTDTVANYKGEWPVDSDSWQWSDNREILEHYNLPREMLFDLKMPGMILGNVSERAARETGLPAGVPVVATANDKAVEALGAGVFGESTGLVSLGTYIAAMVQGRENRVNPKSFWTNFACIPFRYFYESYGIRRGMWTVSWFTSLFGEHMTAAAEADGRSLEQYLEREATLVKPGCDGLMTVLDWLAPTDEPHKRGLMVGFNAYHTRAHMYRSILEAIALTMKNRVDEMNEELGVHLTNLVLSGGGAKSDLLSQIFADVFGIPVERNQFSDAAGLGSAISVAVGLGIYDSYEAAVKKMVKRKDTVLPIPSNTEVYAKINQKVYREIPSYTDQLLRRAYAVFGSGG